MERQKAIQIVREACIAANPKILELKWGCEIKGNPKTEDAEVVFTVTEYGHSNFVQVMYQEDGHPKFSSFGENAGFVILGRPIHLADVLLSMPGYSPGERIMGVDHEGTFVEWGKNSSFEYVKNIPQWNLRADSLTEQTTETLLFLAELLGKGK